MIVLVLGLSIFLGVHSVRIVAPAWRERIIARIGPGPWRGLFSLAAAVGLVAIVWGYAEARMQPTVLYTPPLWGRHLVPVLLLPVFVLLAAAYLPGRIKRAVGHPMLASVALWGGAHLLANGTLADTLLFGGLVTWALADWASVRRRPATAVPPTRGSARNDAIAVVVGLLVYAIVVLWLHAWWLGVAPLPM